MPFFYAYNIYNIFYDISVAEEVNISIYHVFSIHPKYLIIWVVVGVCVTTVDYAESDGLGSYQGGWSGVGWGGA